MYGHLFLILNPGDVGVELPPEQEMAGDTLERLIQGSKVPFLEAARNVSGNGFVMRAGDELHARWSLLIDPFSDTLRAEARFAGIPVKRVELHCWVSNQRCEGDRNGLVSGTWRDEHKKVALTVDNAPSKDDRRRMAISIFCGDLVLARETLLSLLRGKIRIENPFII